MYIPTFQAPAPTVATPIAGDITPRKTADSAQSPAPNPLGKLVNGFLEPNIGHLPPVAGANDFGQTPPSNPAAYGPGLIAYCCTYDK